MASIKFTLVPKEMACLRDTLSPVARLDGAHVEVGNDQTLHQTLEMCLPPHCRLTTYVAGTGDCTVLDEPLPWSPENMGKKQGVRVGGTMVDRIL